MGAPAIDSKLNAAAAALIYGQCPVRRGKADQSNSLAGPNHCIGVCHTVVDMVFRFLRSKCAACGGTLSDSELKATQEDLIDGLQSMFDFFDDIHRRCMTACNADAPQLFAKGQMLSSLLFICGRGTADRAFSNTGDHLSYGRLKAFYDVLAKHLRRRVAHEAETRLTNAYIKASVKHGQSLTVAKLLQEQAVKNVLRECLRPFESPEESESFIAGLNDEFNAAVDGGMDDAGPCSHRILAPTMRKFLERFPQDMRVAVGGPW